MTAKRIGEIGFSPTLATADLARRLRAEGRDVLDFSAGQPDFDTPADVKAAGIRAIEENRTRYTANAGIPELREALADWYRRERELDYDPADVVVSPGGKATLYFAFLTLCDPGDEVLLPTPYWTSYPEQIKLAGATPVFVDCDESEGFLLDPERLEAACTPRSRVLVINDPSNPTGAGYAADRLEAVAEVCRRRDLIVVSDEIYSRLVYGKHVFRSIAALPGMKERTLVVDGMSKTFAMTGWRLGYALGPSEIVRGMSKLQSHATSHPTSITQWASVEALSLDPAELERRRIELERRRNAMVTGLRAIAGVTCVEPQGAFYVFPNVSKRFDDTCGSGQEISTWLLEQAGVAVVPGEAFGRPEHVRLSYACSLDEVRDGVERIARAFDAKPVP